MVEFDYEELVKATECFSPSRLIGRGSHGSVYKGILQDRKVVAVKKSTVGFDHVCSDNSKKLENEIFVLSSLSESPHTIKFLGTSHHSAAKEKKSKLLVMEFMPNGSLHDLLHVAATPPSWPKRVEIVIRISKALQFLHEDFGLAVLQVDSSNQHTSQPAGTLGYLDPSYTTPSRLSTRNDIFSYGVLLLEIMSGRKVIDVSRLPASIVEWAAPLIGKKKLMEVCDKRIVVPSLMEGTIKHLLNVAAHCVSSKEENRPSISENCDGDGLLLASTS